MRGEAIAIAAGGLDDIGVADGLELAAEGADTGEMMSLDISSAPKSHNARSIVFAPAHAHIR